MSHTPTIKHGFKNTRVRSAIIKQFERFQEPLSALVILKNLLKENLKPNKTTVYRELTFLTTEGLLLEIQFADRTKRYELASREHHHHLVCLCCKRVIDVELENDLDVLQEKLARAHEFKIERHSLEFFGLCSKCQ